MTHLEEDSNYVYKWEKKHKYKGSPTGNFIKTFLAPSTDQCYGKCMWNDHSPTVVLGAALTLASLKFDSGKFKGFGKKSDSSFLQESAAEGEDMMGGCEGNFCAYGNLVMSAGLKITYGDVNPGGLDDGQTESWIFGPQLHLKASVGRSKKTMKTSNEGIS